MELTIRPAKIEDASVLLEIYRYYVENTGVSMEHETPSLAAFQDRIRVLSETYPYLVAEADGEAVGYVYAAPYHPRAGFRWSAEASIYVRKDMRCAGIGKELYAALEKALTEQGFYNLYASIVSADAEDAYVTFNSLKFHSKMGFKVIGTFRNSCNKFGNWYHLVWMEKTLRAHLPNPIKPNCPNRETQ